MKILHLTGESEDAGGVLTVLRNLQSTTRGEGQWEFAVWVRNDFRETRHPRLRIVRSRHACASDGSHLQMLLKSFPGYMDVCKLLDRELFDLVHVHSRGTLPIGMWLTIRKRIPVVFTNHNFARRRWLYRLAARVRNLHSVMLTPNMARYYEIDANLPNISIISACFSDDLLDRPLIRGNPGNVSTTIRLVGIGNIVKWKNWHLLLRALQCLPRNLRNRFYFDHFGPTLDSAESRSYEAELQSEVAAADLGERVRFHGSTSRIYEQLSRADWFILPSTNEPCSVALMEALACGMPAIASKSGGSIDIIEHGRNGALFQADDPSDLAKILASIAEGTFQTSSAESIRESVRFRSASSILTQYASLYCKMLGANT